MSDRRSTRQERAGGSPDEHLLDREKQLERQTETDDARRATPAAPESGDVRRGEHAERGDMNDDARDPVDEASEESFPASDPPQQP